MAVAFDDHYELEHMTKEELVDMIRNQCIAHKETVNSFLTDIYGYKRRKVRDAKDFEVLQPENTRAQQNLEKMQKYRDRWLELVRKSTDDLALVTT